MSLAARIAAGFLAIVALHAASSWWQLEVVEELVANNRGLAEVDVEVLALGLGMWSRLGELRELSDKYEVLRDERYRDEIRAVAAEVTTSVADLASLPAGPATAELVAELEELWLEAVVESGTPPATALELVRGRLAAVLRSAREEMQREAEASAAAAARARSVAWSVAIAALAISVVLVVVLARSVAAPVGALAVASRKVATGDFSARVPSLGPPEIRGLARDFNEMASQLDKLDDLKRDLVSNVSHDLKAPLASMQETTRLLLDRVPGELNGQQERLLRLNLESGRRLAGMIANVLDLSRLDAGAATVRAEECDLEEMLEACVEELRQPAESRHTRIRLGEGVARVVVSGDADLLPRAFANVLHNAVKFSPEGSEVRVDAAPGEAGEVIVDVVDAGPGVAAEQRSRVFERFHRADATQRGAQGTGLGLAITKAIVVAHRGRIWIEDAEGGGSCFRIALPGRLREVPEVATRG